MKKALYLIFISLLLLSGCENKNNNNIHSSFESLMSQVCYVSTNKVTYNEFLEIFPIIMHNTVKKDLTENMWNESLENNKSIDKSCTYKNIKTLNNEMISKTKEYFTKYIEEEFDFIECKIADLYIENDNLDDVGACKFKKDNKWYIIEF